MEQEFGNMEEYRQQYISNVSRSSTQEHMAKMVEWYGDKELVREFLVQPVNSRIGKAYGNRIEEIYRKIGEKKQQSVPVTEFQVKSLIGELKFVMKEFLQVNDKSEMLKTLMVMYRTNSELAKRKDAEFGEEMAK